MPGPTAGANQSALNLSVTTIIKATPGSLFTVTVVTAGSAVGGVYDNNLTTGNTAANQIGIIPNTVGSYQFYGWPCLTGITYVVGTGQVVAVAYS